MGINMDIRNEPKYSFLDLRDLDEADKNEIAKILRLDTSTASLKLPWDIGEKEYEIASELVESPSEDMAGQWQQYAMPEGIASYEMQAAPMMSAAMPTTHPYASHPQMMTYTSGDFSPMGNHPTAYSYISNIPYGLPATMYSSSQPELMNQGPPSRDNERRGSRSRGGKRGDNYNRQMNSNNEIQTGYIVQGQHQFRQMLPMCHTSAGLYSVSPNSHPAAGPPIFIQPSPGCGYPQNPQMHHNSHPSYTHHQAYPSHTHQTSGPKYTRDSGTGQTTYYNQESPKNLHKHHEKRVSQAHDPPPPFRHASNNTNSNNNNEENADSSPTKNYGKTPLVNNSNASVDAINNSTPPIRHTDNKKVTADHEKPELDIAKVKDESNDDKNGTKESAFSSSDNNNTVVVTKDKTPLAEREISSAREEKVSPGNFVEIVTKTVKVTETTGVEHNGVIAATKDNQESLAKDKEISSNLPTVSSTMSISVSPPVSTTTWAGVLKKTGPPGGDIKLPISVTKLPVATPNLANFSSPPVLEAPPAKIATPEPPPKNENAGQVTNRNSVEPPVKSGENSPWAENKIIETPQNNLNDPAVFRMGELLLKYQMDKQTVSLLPRGLTNRSNYCYINSILQALLACPPFYNLLMALPHPRNSMKNSPTPLIDNMVRFVREFNPLSEGARMPRKDKSQKRGEETAVDVQCGIAFEPSYVYTMLKNTSCAGGFSVEGRQEDAEEFLSCLLNGISDEMLELMKLVNSESNDATSNPTESNVNFSNADEGWKIMGPKNKGSITRCTEFGRTPLSDIFRGQLRSKVSRIGDETTDNVQPFFTLQLDIEKAESVDAALEILVGKDQVEGMTCSKTKQQIEAWKQVLLEELPIILILHLKWFDYKLDGCSKIFKRVGFPIDLKLDGKLLSTNAAKKFTRKQRQYKLFAVTYHDGKEASKGHYVTDAFHVGYNAWVRYDDSSVKGINEMDVLNPTPPRVPYLLYYRRCDTIGNNPSITTRTR